MTEIKWQNRNTIGMITHQPMSGLRFVETAKENEMEQDRERG